MTDYIQRKHQWIENLKNKGIEVYKKYATEENLNKCSTEFINFPFILDVFSPFDSLTVSKDGKQAFIATTFINNKGKEMKIRIKVI